MKSSKPIILMTNDDGIGASGLDALFHACKDLGDIWVVAPDREQSASSHSVSLHRPLRVTEIGPQRYMVDGTPVDCVMLATRHLIPHKVDLVISGVNRGANLGDDVTYSGTVAGAREGMLLGIPSIAVSNISDDPQHFDVAASVARLVATMVLDKGLPDDTLLNINVPDKAMDELGGVEWTCMGRRHYEDEVLKRADPRGKEYYWIGGSLPDEPAAQGTDVYAINEGKVSITPLLRDTTHQGSLTLLREWNISL